MRQGFRVTEIVRVRNDVTGIMIQRKLSIGT